MFLKKFARRGSSGDRLLPREDDGGTEWQTVKVAVAQLRQAIACPTGAHLNEWLAVNLVDFYNHVLLLYARLKDRCSPKSCPTLNGAPKTDVPWFGDKKSVKITAPEYFQKATEWVQLQLDSDLFPRAPGEPFPPAYVASLRVIYRQIFRMYQHIYAAHRDHVRELGLDDVALLNTCYIHFWLFVTRFSLVDQKEVEAMRKVTQTILHAGANAAAATATTAASGGTPLQLAGFTGSESPGSRDSGDLSKDESVESFIAPKLAIIGAGWGLAVQVHAFRLVGFQVSALWTNVPEDCERIAREHNIPYVTSNYEELLQRHDVTIFAIATPSFMHYSMTTKALEAFKHVICEPPLAINHADAKILTTMSHKVQGRRSILDLQLRFLPTVRKMKELIAAGYCGKIFSAQIRMTDSTHLDDPRMSWKFQLPAGGGVLYRLGPHCFDLLTWLLSLRVTSVLGNLMTVVTEKEDERGERKEVTADDTATVQVELENGMHASIHASAVHCGPASHKIEIAGTEGWLELNDNVLSGGKSDGKGQRTVLVLNDQLEAPLDTPFGLGTHAFAKSLYDYFTDAPFELRDKNMVETHAATFEDGRVIQALCDAVRASDRDRTWVAVG